MRVRHSAARAGLALTLGICLLFPWRAASAEENGLKVGSGRLHPSLETRAEYDSLVKVESGGGNASGGFLVHLKPGLDFENKSNSVVISLRALGDANLYTGLISRGNRKLSYFGGDLDLSLDANPNGSVGFQLSDRFAHSDRNSAVAIGGGVRSISNELEAALPIRPGGGALEIIPSLTLQLEAFLKVVTLDPAVGEPSNMNYLSYKPALQGKWRFLPKTAVVIDVSSDIRQYTAGAGSGSQNLIGLYARAGLSGLITPKLSLVLNAGYGRTFTITPTYSSVIGQAEINYRPNPFTELKVGYVRTFAPVPQLNWYEDNRIYAGGSVLLAGRLLLDFKGAFDLVGYSTKQLDTVASLELGLRARITEWFDAGAAYRLEERGSSVSTGYLRHVVGGFATFRY